MMSVILGTFVATINNINVLMTQTLTKKLFLSRTITSEQVKSIDIFIHSLLFIASLIYLGNYCSYLKSLIIPNRLWLRAAITS